MDPNSYKRFLIFNQNSKLEDSFAPNNRSTWSNFGQAKQNQAIHLQIKNSKLIASYNNQLIPQK